MYCTTDLCLSVDKLKTEKTKEQCQCTEVIVYVRYILSTVKTESTHTPARLDALFKSSQPSLVPSRIRSPSFLPSDCDLGPSRRFVKRSAVLSFVSTRSTDRRFSRIHCCSAKHRISMCLSPPGPLRCRMCLAESESISRRFETLQCSSLKSPRSPAQALAA